MSIAVGVRTGVRCGIQTGANPSSGVSWSRDAAANKGVPASADEWSSVLSTAGYPSLSPAHLFSMQDVVGALADDIGALALAPSGTVAYQQTVTGWARKAVKTTDGTPGLWSVAAGSGPNPGTQSVAYLLYAYIPSAPATERGFAAMSFAASHLFQTNVTAAGLPKQYTNAAGTASVQAITGAVHPLLAVYDRTNSRSVLYTDLEKKVGTYSASVTDGAKGFGHATVPPTAYYLYGAWFAGPNAELSDAAAKAILETLGWTIPWS